jgi:hypothetical protein
MNLLVLPLLSGFYPAGRRQPARWPVSEESWIRRSTVDR